MCVCVYVHTQAVMPLLFMRSATDMLSYLLCVCVCVCVCVYTQTVTPLLFMRSATDMLSDL